MGLFGGKPENGPDSNPPVSSGRGSAPSGAPLASKATTVIGRETIVKGEIVGDTDMLIEGRVEGRIHGAKGVIIGESGDVEARVEAQVVTIRGKVNGDCEAKKVEITATGKVFGNISAGAIVVAEGATFRGASKMSLGEPPPAQKQPAPEPAQAATATPMEAGASPPPESHPS